MTAVVTRLAVGLPPEPLPLATAIWPDVPVIVTGVARPLPTATRPVPDSDAMLEISPVRLTVGLPVVPSALVTPRLAPTAICTPVSVVEFVLTWMPVGDEINDAGAPVTARVYWPCAPVVVDVSPVPVLIRWLLGSVGSLTRVTNVCVCAGDAAMAPVVV